MKSILDQSFRYTPSHKTDLRKTFARLRAQQKNLEPLPAAVLPLKRKASGGQP